MNKEENKLVFVSYAHEDAQILKEELLPFLEHLDLRELIQLWHDQLIETGEEWYAEIFQRLESARLAVLVITQNYLSSKFCLHEELPILHQRARRGEIKILPLLAKPCLWELEPWLRRRQMFVKEKKALSEHEGPARDRALTEFAQQVLEALKSDSAIPSGQACFDGTDETYDLHRLPETYSLLLGRLDELRRLDRAWDDQTTNVVAFTAGGGVGKSTLARVWAEMMAEDGWRGAERAFAWSFYSQGTGRMTDSEAFINEALKWFGDDTPEGLSLWDRGERLANCVRERRTLLILDGVEPLQSGKDDVDPGSIRDPGLRTLLEELARENPGLCVVTTRESLSDLAEFGAPEVLHQDLDHVSTLAGRALLRVERIRGEDEALEAAVEDLGGHALAVSLLSNLLTDGNAKPDISNAKKLPKLTYPEKEGGHPRRVLDAWAKRLGESAELELLQIVGLFNRPADLAAVQAVIDGDALPGLTKHLGDVSLDDVLKRLRGARLLARKSEHEDTIDAHPIVREHFGERLKAQHPKSWREGHWRLYQHHKDKAEHRPDDLPGMQPLFAAVVHGCAAGLHQEVCDEVYSDRILRRKEAYLNHKLGAHAADLSCLSHFFEETWIRPESSLTSLDQTWFLSNAGYALRALGRLREAVDPFTESHRQDVARDSWENASVSAGNLSELHLALGKLAQAEALARDAVNYADKSGVAEERVVTKTIHAAALYQLGRTSDARELFAEAESMQAEEQPMFSLLYSVRGYLYCDFLLDKGEADEVLRRAEQTLEWATARQGLLDIALGHLSLGRAHMATSPLDPRAAAQHIRTAVDGLRTAGSMDHIPRGLFARAEYHRSQDRLDLAERDLAEVRTIVRRTGMRLFEADLELEQTRWHIAKNDRDSAGKTLEKARELVEDMGYVRRRPEVEELEEELRAARAPGERGA